MERGKALKLDKITMGTCYYPEHWEEGLWKEDLSRMKKAGIEVIRIAEFAWNKFEPEEGIYTFDFFDRFMETAQAADMKVIFCTPTATPPAWLTEKYPEVLNCTVEGNRYYHGSRRQYNYNSPIYLEAVRLLTEKLGMHYGGYKNIIGWQIDNEVNCQIDEFYSESDDKAFRCFIQEKYKSLDAVNQAWGTVFWNQTYTDWEQIHIPRKVVSDSPNPHQFLDYIRFISKSARNFVKLQSGILRKYIKEGDFITTNGLFSNLNNHDMTEESLDFIMYDSYPNFAFCLTEDPKNATDLNDRKWSRNLTEVRSISKTFGIMEQQSGANGWNCSMEAPAPKPGQLTLWTMQSVAHGADYISYFRWRTCTMGTEIYWHGILDYSNRDNRKLSEVTQVSRLFDKIKEAAGAKYKGAFAVLKDYNNLWDSKIDLWHKRLESASEKGIFKAAQLNHTPMDYVYLLEDTKGEDLLKYPAVFYPHGVILTEQAREVLTSYVTQGGTLILGCRTGYKDETGKCVMKKLPGLLQELSGADVVDSTFVGPADETTYIDWDGTKIEAAVYNDILEPLGDAEVIGTYTNQYYEGKAGIIRKNAGKGQVYYFGGAFSKEAAEAFLDKLGIVRPYEDVIILPEECELAVREKDGADYLFVLNYSARPVKIVLKGEVLDLYEERKACGDVMLAPYGTKVYRL